jgi:hypothetical protein
LQAGKNKRGYLVQLEAKRRLATKTMWSWQVDATPFFSSFSILPYLFFLLFVFFLHFLCLYLCSCSPCPIVPLFICSLPQFVPVFLSWSALFLVQWLLKMEL